MLTALTALIMLVLAYFYFHEGLLTSFSMLLNVFIAGLVAFNFWEPLANLLDPVFSSNPPEHNAMWGYEDFICLIVLFSLTLGLLRLFTNRVCNIVVEFNPLLQQFGGAFFGVVTGYLLSGILITMFQTLPWHENSMGYEPYGEKETGTRRLFPPDRVWRAMLRHAGAYPLARGPDPKILSEKPAADPYELYPTFDRYGTFEFRYRRHRHYGDTRNPEPYPSKIKRLEKEDKKSYFDDYLRP